MCQGSIPSMQKNCHQPVSTRTYKPKGNSGRRRDNGWCFAESSPRQDSINLAHQIKSNEKSARGIAGGVAHESGPRAGTLRDNSSWTV